MTTIQFEVLTDKNSCILTLTNNLTGHSETVITGNYDRDIAYACMVFKKQHRISLVDVGYAIQYPEERVYIESELIEDSIGDSNAV